MDIERKSIDNKMLEESITCIKECFDTNKLHNGVAIRVTLHTGEEFNALIADAGTDYIQCYKLSGITGEPSRLELFINNYISGDYGIKML